MRTLIVTLIFLPMLCMAQENLVPNSSFEIFSSCPQNISQIALCPPWTNPTNASPDYFNFCSEPEIVPPDTFPRVGVPKNIFGTQTAKTGNAYTGIYGVQLGNQEIRDYVQVELTEPLFYRIRYAVSFYVSLSESSRYAISTLGAHLSVNAIASNNLLVLDAEPQILPDPLQPISDTTGWVLVTDTFVSAEGGEKYLTIGNFFSDAESDTVFFNPNPPLGNRFAYYYIDDVFVYAIDSVPNGIEEQEELGFDVWPNPATEVLKIGGRGQKADVRLVDMRGREVLHGSGMLPLQMDIGHLRKGLYMVEVGDNGWKTVKKVVVQ